MDYEARIRMLLRQKIGLDESSIGASTVNRSIQRAMKAANCASLEEFWRHLNNTNTAVQALIEYVIVPETWFFRDPIAFSALQTVVVAEWQAETRERPLRVLSMPCATGEEPYSIAISLFEALGRPAGFLVDAVDISRGNLAKAIRAEYGSRAFRGQDLSFRQQYLEKTPGGYRVRKEVRECVN